MSDVLLPVRPAKMVSPAGRRAKRASLSATTAGASMDAVPVHRHGYRRDPRQASSFMSEADREERRRRRARWTVGRGQRLEWVSDAKAFFARVAGIRLRCSYNLIVEAVYTEMYFRIAALGQRLLEEIDSDPLTRRIAWNSMDTSWCG